MNSDSVLTHAQLGEMLSRLRLGVGASDLHGSLTGYVCGGGNAGARGWLDALELKPEAHANLPDAALTRLYEDCVAWFEDPELRFEPLLPETDTTLDARADALVEWCRGFLGGLGLAGVSARAGLSPDASEILHDLGTIAGSRFEYDDAEEDENALAEVIEFIRVGVLLLHAELNARPGATTVH
jgi:uncharacterized protein YgfB (UPF0149 family)